MPKPTTKEESALEARYQEGLALVRKWEQEHLHGQRGLGCETEPVKPGPKMYVGQRVFHIAGIQDARTVVSVTEPVKGVLAMPETGFVYVRFDHDLPHAPGQARNISNSGFIPKDPIHSSRNVTENAPLCLSPGLAYGNAPLGRRVYSFRVVLGSDRVSRGNLRR